MKGLTWEVVTYELAIGITKYRREELPVFPLPDLLHVTRPWNDRIAAAYVVSPGDNPKTTITGLRPVGKFYIGNVRRSGRKRLLVAAFSECHRRLHVGVANRHPRNLAAAAALGFDELLQHRKRQLQRKDAPWYEGRPYD